MNILTLLPLIGRALIGFYFVFFGLWNIYHWRPFIAFMIEKNIPLPFLILPILIFWQISAGAMIMFGSYVKITALTLIPFTIIAVCVFHAFWHHHGEARKLHLTLFITQLSISLGAILLLLNNITPLVSFTQLTS